MVWRQRTLRFTIWPERREMNCCSRDSICSLIWRARVEKLQIPSVQAPKFQEDRRSVETSVEFICKGLPAERSNCKSRFSLTSGQSLQTLACQDTKGNCIYETAGWRFDDQKCKMKVVQRVGGSMIKSAK